MWGLVKRVERKKGNACEAKPSINVTGKPPTTASLASHHAQNGGCLGMCLLGDMFYGGL